MRWGSGGGTTSYDHYDGRGDVATQTSGSGTVSYQATYEAWGTRTAEYGANQDRQRANTKEEDPSGLLDEGQRYRDLETGTFLTPDPTGMVDGPNIYAYVNDNPWTKFDPEGLSAYSNLVDSAANDLAQDHYASGYAKATVAALWEAFSFHSASRNGAVGDAYDAGQISAGQAAVQFTANTASAAKDAALTYGAGGVVGKAAQAYARAEAVVDTGEALIDGDFKGAGLSALGAIAGGRGEGVAGNTAKVVNQESKVAAELAEDVKTTTKTARQARREAMREAGIPTSQQPVSQRSVTAADGTKPPPAKAGGIGST